MDDDITMPPPIDTYCRWLARRRNALKHHMRRVKMRAVIANVMTIMLAASAISCLNKPDEIKLMILSALNALKHYHVAIYRCQLRECGDYNQAGWQKMHGAGLWHHAGGAYRPHENPRVNAEAISGASPDDVTAYPSCSTNVVLAGEKRSSSGTLGISH